MVNVEMKKDGNILTITVDLSQENGESKSGKTLTVASTKGNHSVPDTDGKIKIGLNVYKYKD